MNATSKYIYDSANYYFNGDKNLINSYFLYGIKDVLGHNTLHIETLREVKRASEPLHLITRHIKGDTKYNNQVDKSKQRMINWKKQIHKNVIDNLHDNRDLVIWDDNDDNGNYHILT